MPIIRYKHTLYAVNWLVHCLLCWNRYPIAMSPDHISAGAYNRNIDKRLVQKLVWPRETSIVLQNESSCSHLIPFVFLLGTLLKRLDLLRKEAREMDRQKRNVRTRI